MTRRWGLLFVAILVIPVVPEFVHAAPNDRISLAVMPLQAQGGVPKETVAILDSLMAAQMMGYRQFKIITSSDIEGLLGFDAMKQTFDCKASSCAAEIGGALGVSQIITGSVSKLGSKVILTLTRLDTDRAEVLGRGAATGDAAKAEQLIESLQQALVGVMNQPADVTRAAVATEWAKPVTLDWALWGAGVTATAGAAFMWQKAVAEEALSFETGTPGSQVAAENAPQSALASQALAAVGLGLVATGVVHWLFFIEDPDSESVSVQMTTSGAVVTVGGTW